MTQDERGYLILPHELATGADCDGCLIVVKRSGMADLKPVDAVLLNELLRQDAEIRALKDARTTRSNHIRSVNLS